jgi:hypothetical protein
VLITGDRRRVGAASAGDLDADDLVVEAAGSDGLGTASLRLRSELVLLCTADAVLRAEVLGGLDHPARDGMALTAGRHARPC